MKNEDKLYMPVSIGLKNLACAINDPILTGYPYLEKFGLPPQLKIKVLKSQLSEALFKIPHHGF